MLENTYFNQTGLVTGRTLRELSATALRNIKKAYAICEPMIDEHGHPLHSGTTIEEIQESVLQQMYILNHGNATGDEEPDDDNVDAANTKSTTNVADPGTSTPALPSKKSKWIFTGWMAFVMWGPLAPENQRLDIFRIGDVPTEDKKASGHSINRKKSRLKIALCVNLDRMWDAD